MKPITIELIYSLIMIMSGVAATWWLWRSHYLQKMREKENNGLNHIAEAIENLHGLTIRVAYDVDEHNCQVKAINDSLTTTGSHESDTLIDVVANLVQMNHQMQEKLTSTENKLREQAKQLQDHASKACTDALTLLANRRAFDDELTRHIAEYRRHKRIFSLIMADVDHFKKFNDTYGHPTGDEVLRDVARILRLTMRDMDIVARCGGEEFAIILPGTCLYDASRAAMRACMAIEKSKFHHNEREFQVTVSFGVAEVRDKDDGIMLIARADEALYTSKNNGRNCAYRHDGDRIELIPRPDQSVPEPDIQQQQTSAEPCEPRKLHPSTSYGGAPSMESLSYFPDIIDLNSDLNLSSRTTFCQHVRNKTAEWNQGCPAFSVVLTKINHIDQSDNHLNHRECDAATFTLLHSIASLKSVTDIVGHYAPGCFGMLLPTAELPDVIQMADRLREECPSEIFSNRGDRKSLILSIGVAQPLERDDSISLLKRVEAALVAAEKDGAKRTYYHDGTDCMPITEMLETSGTRV